MLKRASSPLSLRVLLLLLVGLLVLVALVFAARDLQQSRAIYRNASLLAERNHLADACLQAVQNFAFERGRSNVVLRGKSPIDDESRDFIDRLRVVGDQRLADVFRRLPDAFKDRGDEVRRSLARVGTLRPALDHDFLLALADRDPALAGQWLFAADDLVASLEMLLIALSNFPGEIDAALERLSTLRTLALQFRTLVGSEASLLGGELSSGRPPSAEAIGQATLLRGRAVQVWSQLELGTQRLADEASSAALDKVRSRLFGQLRPLQDELLGAAAGNRGQSVHLDQYLAASVATLNASVELAGRLSEATAAYAMSRLEPARRQALVSLASIVAILLLAGLVVMVLVRRFTLPLNEAVGRIDRLLGGPAGISPETLPRFVGDEFGRIVQALELLDEALAARDESERISASILDCVPQSIIATDPHGLITMFSPGAQHLLGYTADEMIGRQTPLILHDSDEIRLRAQALSDEQGSEVAPDFAFFIALAKAGSKSEASEWTYLRKDGTRLTVLLAMTTLRNSRGEIDGYLGVATDVTERTLATAQITLMAHHDMLTGLPNRRLFDDRVQVAINRARRENARLALMLVDLDRFKPINDSLGHDVGDLLLKALARRMQNCLRESDTLARIGGDEFVVILPSIVHEQDSLKVAKNICHALCEPFELAGGHIVGIACSIGVAIFPEHGGDEALLLKSADDAMYVIKKRGGNGVALFSRGAASR